MNEDTLARKKAKLQCKGVRIPQELIPELETLYNAPSVRTGRFVFCFKSPEGNSDLIPVFIVNGKRVAKSPFHLVRYGSGFEIWDDDKKYTDIMLIPRPKFYSNSTSDGVPMFKTAVVVAPGHMRAVVNQRCFYQEIGKPCKFCAVQYWWSGNIQKTPLQVAEAIVAGIEEGVVGHASLTTASLATKGKGLEGLVQTAKLISTKAKIPLMFEFEPVSDDAVLDSLLREAKQSGVTTTFSNIECFDERIREDIMPAKGKITTSTYLKTWKKCLELFGKNEVYTVVIVGIGEDDDSILNGVEMAASNGVITFLVPHSPAAGAVFEDMNPPDYERMLSLYSRAANIYKKYGLDLWASTAGCAHGGAFSAIKEVDKFGV